VPAVAVALLKDGKLVSAEAFGWADVENRVPATPETVFKIGSVSKQFLASGIMLLVQDGKLAVDDKVNKFLPDAPQAWEPITLRHLLTHTAGLVRESPGFDFSKVQPDLAVIKAAYSTPLATKPGEKYQYSNVGYFMLAEVIRTVSGKPWAEFLNERIVPNRAHGYAWRSNRLENEDDFPAVRPSGAFLSTIADLVKWEIALDGGTVLTDASKREMWTPVTLNDGRTYPYGFGWQLDDWPPNAPQPTGVPMMRHGGAMNGFRAGYARWPSRRLVVIALTNLSNAQYEGLIAQVATRYMPELKTTPAR
jgi:CubicO group peptidase (beta-lactamase class C family)